MPETTELAQRQLASLAALGVDVVQGLPSTLKPPLVAAAFQAKAGVPIPRIGAWGISAKIYA
jgi:hypothetical protein